MNEEIKISATEQSLIQSGKELINSHLHFAAGTLNIPEPKEVVIYIVDMSEKELDEMERSEKAHKIVLPRFKKSGERSGRGYSCFSYEGRIYGMTRSFQKLELTNVEIQAGASKEAYWEWLEIEEKMRKCLVISNQIELGMEGEGRNARTWYTPRPGGYLGFNESSY